MHPLPFSFRCRLALSISKMPDLYIFACSIPVPVSPTPKLDSAMRLVHFPIIVPAAVISNVFNSVEASPASSISTSDAKSAGTSRTAYLVFPTAMHKRQAVQSSSSTSISPSFTTGAATASTVSITLASGQVYTGGNATVYSPVGNAGACGNNNTDSDVVAALDKDVYGAPSGVGPWCGKQIHVTNLMNNQNVTATIADKCPGCPTSYSVDLSPGAYDQIADESMGTVPISWYIVGS